MYTGKRRILSIIYNYYKFEVVFILYGKNDTKKVRRSTWTYS